MEIWLVYIEDGDEYEDWEVYAVCPSESSARQIMEAGKKVHPGHEFNISEKIVVSEGGSILDYWT